MPYTSHLGSFLLRLPNHSNSSIQCEGLVSLLWLYSSSWITKLLTILPRQTTDIIWQKIISIACIHDLILSVATHSLWPLTRVGTPSQLHNYIKRCIPCKPFSLLLIRIPVCLPAVLHKCCRKHGGKVECGQRKSKKFWQLDFHNKSLASVACISI